MSFFNRWGIGSTVVVELLVLLALAFAVVRYVEWSSDAAMTEFMSAIEFIGVWFGSFTRSVNADSVPQGTNGLRSW